MTSVDTDSVSASARHPYDYFYAPGMELRPAPPGVQASPLWTHLREMQLSEWLEVQMPPKQTPIVRLVADHMWQGDERMDALVERWREIGAGRGRADFERALVDGIDSVFDPVPELVALFDEVDTIPSWFDSQLWERGRQVNVNASAAGWLGMFLQDALATVVSHHVSTSMGQTRRVNLDLLGRGFESFSWFGRQTIPNGWRRDCPQFHDAVRLRLMHAQARSACRRAWQPSVYARYGDPIPASGVMAAAVSFGMTAVLIDHAHGRLTCEEDLAAVLMYWGYLAYLLGTPDELIPRTVTEALQLVDYGYASAGGPTWGTEQMMLTVAPPASTGAGIRGAAKAAAARLAVTPVQAVLSYYGGSDLVRAAFASTPYRDVTFGPLVPFFHLALCAIVRVRQLDDRLPGAHARMLRRTASGDRRWLAGAKFFGKVIGGGVKTSYSAHDSLIASGGCPVRRDG